jgi:hypothetical protein
VTIAADTGSAGPATFTASTSGYAAATTTATETGGGGSRSAPRLHVSGNKLADANGSQVILHCNCRGSIFAAIKLYRFSTRGRC